MTAGFAADEFIGALVADAIPMKARISLAYLVLLLFSQTSDATVSVDWVTVGNPGNAPDPLPFVDGSGGAVNDVYRMGKYEVTAGQYTAFLNAVAKADPNGLYNTNMGFPVDIQGANIKRTGDSPKYSYSVAPDWANRPVNYVSFWDAARFANWLHNGQPTGAQGPGTTEDGAYHHVGEQFLFGRNPGARFFIPTNNEWYKAGFHKNDGTTGNYWDFATSSNTSPLNSLPDPGNHANFQTWDVTLIRSTQFAIHTTARRLGRLSILQVPMARSIRPETSGSGQKRLPAFLTAYLIDAPPPGGNTTTACLLAESRPSQRVSLVVLVSAWQPACPNPPALH